MPFLTGYTLRKAITIDHTYVDSNLTDFPLLVKFTDDADIGAAIDSNGYNIRFTSSDGETLLKYERQSFDNGGSTATGVFWVKVPTISGASNTTIYIYYKSASPSDGADPTNVWDSNFKAVYHMEEDPSGSAPQILDSTSNNKDGTSSGSMTSGDVVTGKVVNAIDFDGGDLIDCGDAGATFPITAEAIIQVTSSGTYTILGYHPASTNAGWRVGVLSMGSLGFLLFTLGGIADYTFDTSPNNLSLNTTYYVAFTADANNGTAKVYWSQGGFQTMSTSIGTMSGSPDTLFLAGNSFGASFVGPLDEIRISNIERSADWLKFTYRNIFEADNEISFGAEESGGGGGGLSIPIAMRHYLQMAGVG